MTAYPDPQTVSCPDCLAAAGAPCHVSNPTLPRTHAGRRDRVRFRAIAATQTDGTCRICGRLILQVTDPATGDPVDTWHPAAVTAGGPPCPPEPTVDPWDGPGWVRFYSQGYQTNRPGHAAFTPIEEPTGAETGR